jgi:hypothetical protein
MHVERETCRRTRLLRELFALNAAAGCIVELAKKFFISGDVAERLAVTARRLTEQLAEVHNHLMLATGQAPAIVSGAARRRRRR